VVPGPAMQGDDPIRDVPDTLGMAVELDDQPVALEVVTAAFDDPDISDDETNETLAMIGADIRARAGDHLFAVALRSSPREWVAASYIMATLVREFDGYGYEMQSESHGRAAWADDLVQGARSGFALPDRDMPIIDPVSADHDRSLTDGLPKLPSQWSLWFREVRFGILVGGITFAAILLWKTYI